VRRVVSREAPDSDQVRVAVAEDLEVVADPELLARALSNVLRNAVRYAGNAGPIDISAINQDGQVELEVKDSGPGVAEEMLGQLFEPFFRPDSARGKETGGVGLGLAIVKTCIQTCHGTVSARNLKPQGFAVTLTVPT